MEKQNKNFMRKLELLPENPGVYLMKDKEKRIIYVGKAKVLKNRIRSYFTGNHKDEKTKKLVKKIYDFDYIIVDSEYSALVTEANLIKKYKPQYNILLKDNHQYPFLKITDEPFPRVIIVREIKKDNSKYFGPYTDVKSIRFTLKTLEKIFPFRDCSLTIPENYKVKDRPCINYQIGRCLAPCVGFVSSNEYKKNISNIINFIKGRNLEIINDLQKEMETFSDNLQFEKAAKIRNQIFALNKTQKNNTMFFFDNKDRDVIGIYQDGNIAAISIIKIISGKLLSKEIYQMKFNEYDSKNSILYAFLSQYYFQKLENLPYKIILPLSPENIDDLKQLLKNKIIIPKRGDNKKIIFIANQNAFNFVENIKLKHLRKTVRTIKPIVELKEKLNLKKLPRKMACFDISTIQGSDTVASAVFFENGKPKKKNYRKFIIKSVEGQDDFASMREALGRYLENIKKHSFEKPDLFIIDGGKGQLNAAFDILKKNNVDDIEMISLAKRLEEVFLPNISTSILMPKSSSAIRVLINIRDEAHRFAITFHRKKRSNRMIASELDNIPGLGQKMKFNLLKEFGSVENIKKMEYKDLINVKGIGEKIANNILNTLNNKK